MGVIAVKHNIEVAHRLYELKGKCEQIHGHSMKVTMILNVDHVDKGGAARDWRNNVLEFGDLKRKFRGYLDETYDHRLLLNKADPFSGPIFSITPETRVAMSRTAVPDNPTDPYEEPLAWELMKKDQKFLPGLQTVLGDPTTENIARWIARDMRELHELPVWAIEVWETDVNMYRWEAGEK